MATLRSDLTRADNLPQPLHTAYEKFLDKLGARADDADVEDASTALGKAYYGVWSEMNSIG